MASGDAGREDATMLYTCTTKFGCAHISGITSERKARRQAREWLAQLECGQRVTVENEMGEIVALYERNPATGNVRPLLA